MRVFKGIATGLSVTLTGMGTQTLWFTTPLVPLVLLSTCFDFSDILANEMLNCTEHS